MSRYDTKVSTPKKLQEAVLSQRTFTDVKIDGVYMYKNTTKTMSAKLLSNKKVI